jgi:hypothetical protein
VYVVASDDDRGGHVPRPVPPDAADADRRAAWAGSDLRCQHPGRVPPLAQLVWDAANICQSLLAPDRTEAQRQAVRERNMAFNVVLQEECAAYANCRYDDNATFEFQFSRSHVSKLDYFHPSLSGQAALAQTTWTHSWWS